MTPNYLRDLDELWELKQKLIIMENLSKEYWNYLNKYPLHRLRELEHSDRFTFGERK
jgi:hypothetical protein